MLLQAALLLLIPFARGELLPRFGDDLVTELRSDLNSIVVRLWQDVGDPRWVTSLNKQKSEPGKEIKQTASDFGVELDDVSAKLGLEQATSGAKLFLEPLWTWAQIEEQLITIDGLYQTMRTLEKRSEFEQQQWTDFAQTALSGSRPSVSKALESLHDLTTKEEGGGLFRRIPRVLEVRSRTITFKSRRK